MLSDFLALAPRAAARSGVAPAVDVRQRPDGRTRGCHVGIFGLCSTVDGGADDDIVDEAARPRYQPETGDRAASTPEDLVLPSSFLNDSEAKGKLSPSDDVSTEDGGTMSNTSSICGIEYDLAASAEPGAIIIFDWDDTLCPTSYTEAKPGCCRSEAAALEEHSKAVEAVLRVAAGLGRVAIVTMSTARWVKASTQKYMPRVAQTLDELQIRVWRARDAPDRLMREAYSPGRSPSYILKRHAMDLVIQDLGGFAPGDDSTTPHRSVRSDGPRNIISIGDSNAERFALQDLVALRGPSRGGERYRCKTIKFKAEPSLSELTELLRTLAEWLPVIVNYDKDLDIGDVEQTGREAHARRARSRGRSAHGTGSRICRL